LLHFLLTHKLAHTHTSTRAHRYTVHGHEPRIAGHATLWVSLGFPLFLTNCTVREPKEDWNSRSSNSNPNRARARSPSGSLSLRLRKKAADYYWLTPSTRLS